MLVKIGSLEIKPPDLTSVSLLGMGTAGFDFHALAPEEKGKHIADGLEAMKNENSIPCKAVTRDGKSHSGYGKLKIIESQPIEAETPVMYRFYVQVYLQS
jgi:hypothetical protein